MKRFGCTVLLLSICLSLWSQKYDYIWMMGYYGQNPHPDLGGFIINFNESPSQLLDIDSGMDMNPTDATISDVEGNLLFYTNGIYIADATNEVMDNGNNINNFGTTSLYQETGLPIPQGALILPAPSSDSLFYVFHVPIDFGPNGLNTHVPILFYSLVDMSLNEGKGAVIAKDQLLIQDTLAFGKLTACKHANGRDWWILIKKEERFSRDIYRLLLTPQGVMNLGKQNPGPSQLYSQGAVGNAVFSPDGTIYVSHEIRFDPLNAIDIYEFDRCEGLLSLKEHFTMDDSIFLVGGASISPDSRWLYIVTQNLIYQFDLWATNIGANKTLVAEFDGFVGAIFPSIFGIPQIGPDGKIYVLSGVADTVMHVIETPNQFGLGSHVSQHSIILPNLNYQSIPNFPNYRLGPLDGSPCDTLGLDNHPKAGFTFFTEELEVTFSDNSYYRPEAWAWDFGDGSGSSGRNPIHTYALPGEYYACLTVSNEYDSDTFCRWVEVDTLLVAEKEVQRLGAVRMYPNPAGEVIHISFVQPGEWVLYDQLGRAVRREFLPAGQQEREVSLAGVAAGLYFWQVSVEGRPAGAGKLIISKN